MAEEDSTGTGRHLCQHRSEGHCIPFTAVKAKTLLIDIANGDNAPLVIRRVVSAQSGIYLLVIYRLVRKTDMN